MKMFFCNGKPYFSILKVSFLCIVVANFFIFLQTAPSFTTWIQQEALQEEWYEFVKDYRQTFRRSPPEGMSRWFEYAQRHECDTRGVNYQALNVDLEFFRQQNLDQGHKLDMDQVIEKGKQITDFFMAFSLEHHKLTIVEYHGKGWGFDWKPIQWKYTEHLMRGLLEPLRQHTPPLTLQFIVNMHDKARDASVNATYPVLSFCKQDYYTNDKKIPNHNNQTTAGKSHLFNATYNEGPHPNEHPFLASRDLLIPARSSLVFHRHDFWFWPMYSHGLNFADRDNVINWRGSTTGEWGTGPRFQMMRQYGGTRVHPLTDNGVSVDFAFASQIQTPDGEEGSLMQDGYRFANKMWYRELQQNKYILDVDGNGFTGRFPGLLRSGSLIFKSSHYREWYHGVMEPFQHYIPVNYDLSDLVEKVAWAHDHPDVVQQIVTASRKRVETRLRRDDSKCYTYRMLLEYQTLFEEQKQPKQTQT
ncbi:KDEL motif-containing protein 1 [Seminavis robusta]|uniref:KDEL motif-containing protein 1 n=1 Tax=Seminavis robusta TaxID=568900 RepID=A0A9N8F3N0_9STRA|nr:KDEL motif-containing protein 1 [Seminavis robusta]|eukprot:Sro3214_g345400.1 KDEL motif-containing protein 1 (473) ;mRNA; f:595-2130